MADEAAKRVVLANPAYRAVWKPVRNQFTGAYRDQIDQLLREIKSTQPGALGEVWKAHLADELTVD